MNRNYREPLALRTLHIFYRWNAMMTVNKWAVEEASEMAIEQTSFAFQSLAISFLYNFIIGCGSRNQ